MKPLLPTKPAEPRRVTTRITVAHVGKPGPEAMARAARHLWALVDAAEAEDDAARAAGGGRPARGETQSSTP